MNKPIATGASILDIAKTTIYKFHYDFMKKKYGDRTKLCYVDTDGCVHHTKTDDYYEDTAPDVPETFDTSCYSKNCRFPLEIGVNKKIPGMMKDEMGDDVMTEFVGLRPKTYSYKSLSNEEVKKCKGVPKCVRDNDIRFGDYKKCLEDGKNIYRKQLTFRSENHTINTIETNKIALSANDDKRFICEDSVNTLALGHYKTLTST